ncbi:flavin reductase [Faunimonas pinastri]|uniref:Flavin reductase n=1 Tax=Faunimonas pinastri TaxID=1855383 RepID=A0A1H9ALE1_9HYPH|nr:flavin reductase [Faunimonas pinastri]SEP77287.1 flavin reductase [Faunimonas pinastri]
MPTPETSETPYVRISRQAFRDAMAHVAAPVHVVASDGPAGRVGVTATAVCSVTDDPPTLLVCLNRRGSATEAVRANGVISVNTLGHGDRELSAIFAGQRGVPMADRFGHGTWTTLVTGAPVLEGGLVSFDCVIDDTAEVGTHLIFYCHVVGAEFREHGTNLIYVGRRYTTTA